MNSKWKTQELSNAYLDGVRGAIPLANAQLQILVKVVRFWNAKIVNVMDLGCGDGILGQTIMNEFPEVKMCFVDFSDHMLKAAKNKIKLSNSIKFIKSDFSFPNWKTQFTKKFDLIISGFSIHHQPDNRKKTLYAEIYKLLNPTGIFLNLEHVASSTEVVKNIFEDYFIDHLFSYHHNNKNQFVKREKIADEFYNRSDKKENILAAVDVHCQWLRDIGFQDVDCFFKTFELALFGGRKII